VARARFSKPSALAVASFASPESSQNLAGTFQCRIDARLFRSEWNSAVNCELGVGFEAFYPGGPVPSGTNGSPGG
jgi:hypothetical protein